MVTKKTVLLVCQDDNLRVALIEQLQSYSEFQVIDCLSAIRLISDRDSEAVIIMISGNDTIENKDLYEEAGLADYIIRPFRFNEFLELIRVRIRH